MKQTTIEIQTEGQGLRRITAEVENAVKNLSAAGVGVVHLFLQHTSASLLIQENADPTAQQDIETYLQRIAPEGEAWHTHLAEGPDDTTSHLKASLMPTALTIPYADGRLLLGTWQGLYVAEHRHGSHRRKIVVTLLD